MACSETLTTQSLFDGALEGEAARSAERHVETCAECKELLTELETTRRAIRAASLYRKADERLRARIAASLDAESHATSRSATRRVFSWPQPFWIGALSGGLATAAAAALAFLLLLPLETDALVADVTTAHIRSLVGSHLVDVSTADPGAASTWLRSHAGLTFRTGAPTGYQLIGVRADYLYGSNAAVAVYRRGRRVVNVFAWPEHEDEKLPVSATANGYNIVFWKHGDVVFCAVSNLPVEALQKFAQTV